MPEDRQEHDDGPGWDLGPHELDAFLDMAINEMEEHQTGWWLSRRVRGLVPSASNVFEEAADLAYAIFETSLNLASDKPLPNEFETLRRQASEFFQQGQDYLKRRQAIRALQAEELIPIRGNSPAIDALVRRKIKEAKPAAYEGVALPENEPQGPGPESLHWAATAYRRELLVLALLDEAGLRRFAGRPEEFNKLVQQMAGDIIPLPKLKSACEPGSDNLSETQKAIEAIRRRLGDRFRQAFGAPGDWRLKTPVLVTDSPEEEMRWSLVWQNLYIELAREARENILPVARRRMWELSKLVVHTEAPQGALEYLKLVSGAYIFGQDPACIILCRSALDAAFRGMVSDEVLATEAPAKESDEVGLAQRIKAAHKEGLITTVIRDMAFEVKHRGDKAVHYDPHATHDVLGTIKNTLTVVAQLCK